MKVGNLVRMARVQPQYFGGVIFYTWEEDGEIMPEVVGTFSNNSVGIVIDIIPVWNSDKWRKNYSSRGVKVLVDGLSGWISADDVEIIS